MSGEDNAWKEWECKLSVRARKAMLRCQISDFAALETLKLESLDEVPLCGPGTIREIIVAIHDANLPLPQGFSQKLGKDAQKVIGNDQPKSEDKRLSIAHNLIATLREASRSFLDEVPNGIAADQRRKLTQAIHESEKILPPKTLSKIECTFCIEGLIIDLVVSASLGEKCLENEVFNVVGIAIKINDNVFNMAAGYQMKLQTSELVRKEYLKNSEFRDEVYSKFLRS